MGSIDMISTGLYLLQRKTDNGKPGSGKLVVASDTKEARQVAQESDPRKDRIWLYGDFTTCTKLGKVTNSKVAKPQFLTATR